MRKKTATTEIIESAAQQEFKPTPHMLVWLDTAVKLGTTSPTAISKEADLNDSNWTRAHWLGIPGFYDWFVSEWQKRRRRLIPELDEIALNQAKKGNFQFWQAINEKVEPTAKASGISASVKDGDKEIVVKILDYKE